MGKKSIEPLIRRFFQWYGEASYDWKWILLITPLILTSLLSVGFFRLDSLRIDDPSFVFTPRDARWRREFNVFATLWPLNENRFVAGKSFEMKRFVNILLRAKDGGDILRENILDEIQALNQWIMNNITVSTDDAKFSLSYQDLCLNYDWVCGGNEHILMLRERIRVGHFIDLTYPKGGNKDTPVYLGSALGNVRLDEYTNVLRSAKITQLFYFLKQKPNVMAHYSSGFSYAVEDFLLKHFRSDLITISFAHYQSLQDGLEENAKHFKPNFIISFTTLCIYAIAFSFIIDREPRTEINWIRSKPYVACAGLLTTLLALSSGFGAMLLFGVPYNVINTIIPFLIIAIGIDDMFIMNACWDRTDSSENVNQRVSDMMAHAGVAISITNITDILSFAVGCITPLPGIQLFCSYACVTVTFCYLYQLTFFTAFLALMGDVEKSDRHCLFFYRIKSSPTIKHTSPSQCNIIDDSLSQQTALSAARLRSVKSINEKPKRNDDEQRLRFMRRFFVHTYGPFIVRSEIRLLVIIAYILFIAFAIIGCLNFKEGLDPKKLIANNHYMAAYFEDLKEFWVCGPQLHVALLNAPNFSDPIQREKMMAVVQAFENTEHTLGREGTVFFFLEYLNYLDDVNAELENTDKLWNSKLRTWLKYTGGSNQWTADIKFNQTDHSIESFRFQIALKNMIEPNDHKMAAKLLRDIADRQPLKVEIYHETFPFADQYLIIMPATIRNIVISLLCMSFVALLLIPSVLSSLLILLSIISICTGVFGYMTFWSVNLDAVSMISIIMSIGFAVDLSAHITYAFVASSGHSKQRVVQALGTLGWPIFQGATSTIVGISILYTVDAYIIQTFFKTIWLTMVIGLLHGLLFIPVTLSFLPSPSSSTHSQITTTVTDHQSIIKH
ncbi:unnamed protein product [Anisakis simplex]|uniref:SSD domain-containing protein n=1 Tax=Anisakis simplex TaxID=6269 RepID=A0A0M3JSM1_ANISI|nr:unnamed protein product [Anisakis simplex]